MWPDASYCRLLRTGLLVTGADAEKFLQGLITNDIRILETNPVIYSCILTPQGKFLYDFFIYHLNGGYLIEAGVNAGQGNLMTLLLKYRLRARVEISAVPVTVLAGFGALPEPPSSAIVVHDPRHPDMGWRMVSTTDIPALPACTEVDAALYHERRIANVIPDGDIDAEPSLSTLEEMNIPRLHGVSFKKGCFLGQELTARIENRGLAKRHIECVMIPPDLDQAGRDIYLDGQVCGTLRGRSGIMALALLKDDAVTRAKEKAPRITLAPFGNDYQIVI